MIAETAPGLINSATEIITDFLHHVVNEYIVYISPHKFEHGSSMHISPRAEPCRTSCTEKVNVILNRWILLPGDSIRVSVSLTLSGAAL